MTYVELIEKAVKGRSTNSLAKEWGIPQKTLYNYLMGKSMPDYCTALLLAKEAQVDEGKVLKLLASEEANRKIGKRKLDVIASKLQPSFDSLLRIANACWIKVQQVAQ